MISTADLTLLPDLDGFRRLTRALAALDAVICPDWEYRYYSFDSRWNDGELMASMRDGSGDGWFALICAAGVALHGLAHEASGYRPGQPRPWVFADLPDLFRANFLHEAAFETQQSTFCIWRRQGDRAWRCGRPDSAEAQDLDDGSENLLAILDGDPRRFVDYAAGVHELQLSPDLVRKVYRQEPMTPALARNLNPSADHAALRVELRDIGYPDGRKG